MKPLKIIRILVFVLTGFSVTRCTKDILLHGEITGNVTDAETTQPLKDATVKLVGSEAVINTANDGEFRFGSLTPGITYTVEASKTAYSKKSFSSLVEETHTVEMNFELEPIPWIEISDRILDFGDDSIHKYLTIKNIGAGELKYSLTTLQDWITIDPPSGDATNETDTIRVTVDRTGLTDLSLRGMIRITSDAGSEIKLDTVDLLLNYVKDEDMNYYGTIRIGTQVWMDENLKTGITLMSEQLSTDNGIIEKYCNLNNNYNCDTYGGLYTWDEMRKYYPSGGDDSNLQGICPAGWRIPTGDDWNILQDFLGSGGAGKLKETGTSHWASPNTGATDEYGFRALPSGGFYYPDTQDCGSNVLIFLGPGYVTDFWQVLSGSNLRMLITLWWNSAGFIGFDVPAMCSREAYSVRCIKATQK